MPTDNNGIAVIAPRDSCGRTSIPSSLASSPILEARPKTTRAIAVPRKSRVTLATEVTPELNRQSIAARRSSHDNARDHVIWGTVPRLLKVSLESRSNCDLRTTCFRNTQRSSE
jgi:hypothetical protein